MGPKVTDLLQTILASEPHIAAHMTIVPEMHGCSYAAPSITDERVRNMGVVYRMNPMQCIRDSQLAITIRNVVEQESVNLEFKKNKKTTCKTRFGPQ